MFTSTSQTAWTETAWEYNFIHSIFATTLMSKNRIIEVNRSSFVVLWICWKQAREKIPKAQVQKKGKCFILYNRCIALAHKCFEVLQDEARSHALATFNYIFDYIANTLNITVIQKHIHAPHQKRYYSFFVHICGCDLPPIFSTLLRKHTNVRKLEDIHSSTPTNKRKENVLFLVLMVWNV